MSMFWGVEYPPTVLDAVSLAAVLFVTLILIGVALFLLTMLSWAFFAVALRIHMWWDRLHGREWDSYL